MLRVVVVYKRELISSCGDEGVQAALGYGEIAEDFFSVTPLNSILSSSALIEIVDVVLGSDKIARPRQRRGLST